MGIQQDFAPQSICFGCGPANPLGLRIQSVPHGEWVDCEFMPEPHHEAFPGMLSGGILGTLLDCHSNWTAAYHFMTLEKAKTPPVTVTADYHVKLLRPCPSGKALHMRARVVSTDGNKAVVEAELTSDGKPRATCRGTFVKVSEGHPAYGRWDN